MKGGSRVFINWGNLDPNRPVLLSVIEVYAQFLNVRKIQ